MPPGNVKNVYIILGLGYGDEGKGHTTDYLCIDSKNPIVIRFNGGHQAGHTVFTKNYGSAIFASLGSGTLRGVPTYWSEYCTFCPVYFSQEYIQLSKPLNIFIDLKAPITTHYDILYNRLKENSRGTNKYGSCGVGFGATIDRQASSKSFRFKDLLSKSYLKKLKEVRNYYKLKIEQETNFEFCQFNHDKQDAIFIEKINLIKELIKKGDVIPTTASQIFNSEKWETYIFEGAQGILLDKDFGNRPFITKSNTTSKNALLLVDKYVKFPINVEIYYITRCYSTIHGAGPFTEHNICLRNNDYETNINNAFQGRFRIGYLNIDLLNYSLRCDKKFSSFHKKNIVITCLDQIEGENLTVLVNNKAKIIHYKDLPSLLISKFATTRFSFSRFSEDMI